MVDADVNADPLLVGTLQVRVTSDTENTGVPFTDDTDSGEVPFDTQLIIQIQGMLDVQGTAGSEVLFTSSNRLVMELGARRSTTGRFQATRSRVSIRKSYFDDLTREPEASMRAVYEFLDEPYFAHDFEHFEHLTREDDQQ